MPSGITLISGIVTGAPVALDAKFGPYNSVADALNDLTSGLRYRGLTVGVYESGVLKEYWFRDGTGSEHFVAKSSDVTWDSLSNKPATFPPSTHPHAIADVTGLQTALDAKEDEPFLFTVTENNQTIPTGHRVVRVIVDQPAGGLHWTLNLPATGALKGDTVYVETLTVDGSGQSVTLVSPVAMSGIAVGSVVLGSYETLVARFSGAAWQQVTRDTFVSPVGKHLQTVNTLRGLSLAGGVLAVEPKSFVTVINENLPEANYAFPNERNIRLNATIASTSPVSLTLPWVATRQLYDRIEVWLAGQATATDTIVIRRHPTDGDVALATLNTIGQAAAFILEPSGWRLYPVSQHTHPDATTTASGFLSTADKTKLDGISAGAEANVNADWNATTGDAAILNKPVNATSTVGGFMSSADKLKLDKVAVSGTEVRINVTKGSDIIDTEPTSDTQGQTFTGGASGLIEAKGSAAVDGYANSGNSGENGKAGGSLLLNAGTSGELVGGAGGSINLSGGNAGGGDGGQILITGGAGSDTASQQAAGNGGIINLSGGSTDYINAGGNGGQILMTGGDGSGDTGGNAGTLNLSGGDGNSNNGGSIDLSDGGGSINLRGTGSIQFGLAETRTTLTGTATAERSISLPNASGTLALVEDISNVVTSIGASAAEIFSINGSDILANSTNSDRIVFWDHSASTLNYLTTVGPTFDGTNLFWPVELVIACSDETSNLTTGTAKVTFRAPYAFTLTAVRASVNTAPTGSVLVVDIKNGGTSVLSTKLSIDANEKTSQTAATAAVISNASIANDAEITIDIVQGVAGQMGKGLKVVLIGTRA